MTEILPGVAMSSPEPGSLTIGNQAQTQQAFVAATRAYVHGTALKIPGGLKVGTRFRWRFNLTKTAAGVASSAIAIAVGAAGTTADTDRLSFTKPGGSAAIDEGVVTVEAVVSAVDGSTGVIKGEMTMAHNLASTGHMTIPFAAVYGASAGFDNNDNDLYVGLTLTTGAADVVVSEWATAEATNINNLAN